MRKSTKLSFETLEPRLAMSATVGAALNNGVLSITGSQGDDQLTIERRGARYHVVQTDGWFDAKRVARIDIDLGDGNDSIRLTAPGKSVGGFGKPTNVSAGSGNVTFTGPDNRPLYVGGDDQQLAVTSTGAVSVNGVSASWYNKHISDSSLRTLVRAEAVDQVLSRDDMLDIFDHVAANSTVGATDFADLKSIVQNNTFFVGLGYVQSLSGYVVNGAIPNAHYQGNALGNLSATSTGTQLQTLVDKWFLGLDHPNTQRAGWSTPLTYKVAAGNLFSGTPSYTQVDQGVLGDCYFLSAMTSITTKNAQKIVDMFIDNGDNTWTVQFFNNRKPIFVTIDNMLPVDAQDKFVFTLDEVRYDNPNNVLWAAMAEKAYAEFAEFGYLSTDGPKTNSYAALDEGYPNLAMQNILGVNVPGMAKITTTTAAAVAAIFNQNRPVVFVTIASPPSAQIVSDHVYAMIGYNAQTQTFQLFNPWGITNNNTGKPGIVNLTFAEITQNFGYYGRGTVL